MAFSRQRGEIPPIDLRPLYPDFRTSWHHRQGGYVTYNTWHRVLHAVTAYCMRHPYTILGTAYRMWLPHTICGRRF